MINEKTIDLTRTETPVLRIFALSPNEAIERSRLQEEIWEDEGVIVGRSLDMFISKLRKKLQCDSNIKIVVIRGKGYSLKLALKKSPRSELMLIESNVAFVKLYTTNVISLWLSDVIR